MLSRAGSQEFRRIFLDDIPLIDTRSPIEFARGAFPTSVSLPLMTTEERARVGTCYKQLGQEAAIRLGHELVSGAVKEARVQAWTGFARSHPQGYLYCWRGGLRSQICQRWMHETGCDYPRIEGGYKALRQYLLSEFARICHDRPMLLLGGRTGGNKTRLINEWRAAVDLEALANHLGSSFGRRPLGQPTQLGFENALAVELLKRDQRDLAPGLPILLEDESRLIGQRSLPLLLKQCMAQAPLLVLEVPLEERVENTYRHYIIERLQEWQLMQGAEAGFESFAADLLLSMERIRKRLGGVRFDDIRTLLEQALTAHRAGNPDLHWDWILALLVEYYDPMYDYQLSKRSERIRLRGDRDTVIDYLQRLYPD